MGKTGELGGAKDPASIVSPPRRQSFPWQWERLSPRFGRIPPASRSSRFETSDSGPVTRRFRISGSPRLAALFESRERSAREELANPSTPPLPARDISLSAARRPDRRK